MGSSAEVGLLSASADVDFAGETPRAVAVALTGEVPGACVAASAISFFARRTLPWAALPSVGLKSPSSVASRHLVQIRQCACAALCVDRKTMAAGIWVKLNHGSNAFTTQRTGHRFRAPRGCSLASVAV